ncbi:hypothetical protein Scep_019660 [Stephania cephalantha]|uniref:Uncharacterized protein n=1 Tax=Stephania cephalantha TaxID=152367 RepID=A0AAP0IC61_9MAGN
MTDQTGQGDDSSTSGTRYASADDVHALTQRVATQDSQLQETLRLLRTLVPATATPSTPTTPLPHTTTRGAETPIAAASTAPTPLEAVPEGAVVAPDTQNEAEAHPLVTVIARATEAPPRRKN